MDRVATDRPSLQLRHIAKTVGVPLLYGSGGLWLANRLAGRQRHIALNYHNVDPDVFRRHVMHLRRHATFVDLDTFLAPTNTDPGTPVITVTFDDGYATFVDEIVPILSAFEVPAAWFVPTALVGGDELLWFDQVSARIFYSRRDSVEFQGRQWRLRSWNRPYVAAAITRALKQQTPDVRERDIADLARQLETPTLALDRCRLVSPARLKALDPSLVTVGSHSHTHPQLSQVDDAALTAELVVSKQRLEEWIERPVRHFAFPSGDYSERVVQAVRDAGYASAWTTEARFRSKGDDLYRMPRVPIDDRAPVSVLAAKTTAGIQRWSGV
jgi:peptidoglycan/xylan/chitin deacetylase (PgdA/CDA1 family)